MNQTQNNKTVEDLITEHTVALTKTTEGETEIVSFDTVVINMYEFKHALKELIEKEVINVPLRTGDMSEDDEIIEDTMYDAFVRANQQNALDKLFGE